MPIKLLHQIYYLRNQTRITKKIAVISLLINIILIIAFAIFAAMTYTEPSPYPIDDMDDYLENKLEMEYLENLDISQIEE